jgi:hypothetical protein
LQSPQLSQAAIKFGLGSGQRASDAPRIMELKMIQHRNHSRSSNHETHRPRPDRLVAATAIAPVAYAGVDFDQLRRENLEKDAVNFDQLREENRNKVDFDQLRRENLDKDAWTSTNSVARIWIKTLSQSVAWTSTNSAGKTWIRCRRF